MVKIARRGTVRVKRRIVDQRTVGITVTPVKPAKKVKKSVKAR